MVKSKSEARSAYREGLDRVGQSAYRNAKNADTVKEAAEALEDAAPESEVDFNQYESNYADEYA